MVHDFGLSGRERTIRGELKFADAYEKKGYRVSTLVPGLAFWGTNGSEK